MKCTAHAPALHFHVTLRETGFTAENIETMSLTIHGAAYGLKAVTDQVQQMANAQGGTSLTVKASNDVFGDTWYGTKKSLVVVYQYPGEFPRTNVAKEGEEITIHPDPQSMAEASHSKPSTAATALGLLGAAYQGGDVTEATIELMKGNSLREITAYAATALGLLGAAYGAGDVTEATKKLVKGNSLEITANNDTFHDTWFGVKKTFVGVFQSVGVIIVKEGTYFSQSLTGQPQLK